MIILACDGLQDLKGVPSLVAHTFGHCLLHLLALCHCDIMGAIMLDGISSLRNTSLLERR